ncbi:Protein LAS1 [Grifola frondosa]|uniref:Protein LAS1 n=1 Tax=Grifola frondosa TaxID=5627 RepID=A0A1C7MQR7_GRIFR|nr:Protein LAS1 [Grifola frondosa]
MRLPRRVPWTFLTELEQLCSWIYADEADIDAKVLAVRRLAAWKASVSLPHALESTLGLLTVVLQDGSAQASSSHLSIRMSYAAAIIRLVNGLVDPLQLGAYARSIASIATQLGLPPWLVELRHAATHEELPSIEVLREAARESMRWLLNNYFLPTLNPSNPPSARLKPLRPIAPLLKQYKRLLKTTTRDMSLRAKFQPEIAKALRDMERWISEAKVAADPEGGFGWDVNEIDDENEGGDVRERWALDRFCDALLERGAMVPLSRKKRISPGTKMTLTRSLLHIWTPMITHLQSLHPTLALRLVIGITSRLLSRPQQEDIRSDVVALVAHEYKADISYEMCLAGWANWLIDTWDTSSEEDYGALRREDVVVGLISNFGPLGNEIVGEAKAVNALLKALCAGHSNLEKVDTLLSVQPALTGKEWQDRDLDVMDERLSRLMTLQGSIDELAVHLRPAVPNETSEIALPLGWRKLNSPQGAISLFDLHLKVLADSYLSFFQERKKVEEAYVSALLKLHHKSKAIDNFLDDHLELNTTRAAWGEISDNDSEASTRTAFLEALSSGVIEPLASFKDYKATSVVAPPLSPTIPSDPGNFIVSPRQSLNNSRPVVTAPQPLRPLDRRPSTSAISARNRSPSSSTTLQDLAHQGKKQLNQLMTFLDKSGNVKESLGGGRSDNALRSVRAKREADEADKEYRKAVHWLETLRLRRVKILESGYNSLESFVRESAETVKNVLEIYTDNLTATAATLSQLCDHGRQMVMKISPQKDSSVVAANIPHLIFGVGLVDYATTHGLSEGEVPKIVRICIDDIEQRGMDAEGLYRVSGRHSAVQELQHKIERNEAGFSFNPAVDDVYVVSNLLKLYLRELPEPIFKFPLQERIQHTEDLDEHVSNNFMVLRSKMRRLPAIHQATLKAIVEHLARVAARSDKNKMDSRNLAIVFGSVIFGDDDFPRTGDLLSVQSWKDTLMEDLITHASALFAGMGSPPLPGTPLGDVAAAVTYGSSHTSVSNMPPPSPQRSPEPSDSLLPSLLHTEITPSSHKKHPPIPSLGSLTSRSPTPSIKDGPWFDDQISVPTVPPNTRNPESGPSTPLPLRSPWPEEDPSLSTGTSSAAQSRASSRTSSRMPLGSDKVRDEFNNPTSLQSSATNFESALSSSASAAAFASQPSPRMPASSLPQLSPPHSADHATFEIPGSRDRRRSSE